MICCGTIHFWHWHFNRQFRDFKMAGNLFKTFWHCFQNVLVMLVDLFLLEQWFLSCRARRWKFHLFFHQVLLFSVIFKPCSVQNRQRFYHKFVPAVPGVWQGFKNWKVKSPAIPRPRDYKWLLHYPKYIIPPSNSLQDIKQNCWTSQYRSLTNICFLMSIFVSHWSIIQSMTIHQIVFKI